MNTTPTSTFQMSEDLARDLLKANGLQAGDTPGQIRSALASSIVDIYWEAMKAHFDCPDRHSALNSILTMNKAMDEAVKHAQSIPDLLSVPT